MPHGSRQRFGPTSTFRIQSSLVASSSSKSFNNEVMALDLQSKKLLWKYTPTDRQFPFYSSAAIADGKVVLGGRVKMVHAFKAKTGKLLWTFTTRAGVDSSPAIAGRVFVGSNDGRSTGSISPAARRSGNTKPPRP
jgi:eukaryotic-like serine/threonine-protein kinase